MRMEALATRSAANPNTADDGTVIMSMIGCIILLLLLLHGVSASLISSSEIQLCTRKKSSFEPMLKNGQPCEKKFLISLAVRNGQVQA